MSRLPRSLCVLRNALLLFGCALGLATSVQAEGFALSDWGARGTGLAGGMVGRADDPSAVAHNPAGITQLPGTQMMGGFTLITPMGTVDTKDPLTGASTSTNVKRNWWFNPHGFVTHQLTDRAWLGFGVYSRFGLGNNYPKDWPGRANLVDVSLRTMSVNPNFAYKVTDSLSLAVGVDVMYATMEMNKDTPLVMGGRFLGYNEQKLTGDSIALGFNVAAHYTFNEQWAAGLTYRSRMRHSVTGNSSWNRQVPGSPMLDSSLHGNLDLPDVIAFGLTWKPVQKLSIEAGAVYTVWSEYRNFNIYLEQPSNYGSINPKHWRDTWGLNLSGEYKALDWLVLRAGYAYETSPMHDKTMDYMTPSEGRHRIGLGAGFIRDQWTIDVAYSYLHINAIEYDNSKAPGVLDGRGHEGNSHIIAVSVGYKF